MTTKLKYRVQEPEANKGAYRLTLTAAAFARAVVKSKPIAGYVAYARIDGQWDVMVSPATANQLQQQRLDGEHLTDVVERLLKEMGDGQN
jgi:hypothetical protein